MTSTAVVTHFDESKELNNHYFATTQDDYSIVGIIRGIYGSMAARNVSLQFLHATTNTLSDFQIKIKGLVRPWIS